MLSVLHLMGQNPLTPIALSGDQDASMLVAARVSADFEAAMFEPDFWQNRNAVTGMAGGRGKVLFVAAGDEQWVLRHYQRGGLMTPLFGDLYIWRGAEKTRGFRECRLLAQLHTLGLPVPQPVAARFVRDGIFYRADLITVRIPDTFSLAETVARRVPAVEEWQAIGRCIRRFHDADVYHADLNAHNILLAGDGGIFVVDFDRSFIRTGSRWKKSNLRRLNRSLHKIGFSLSIPSFEQKHWPALLQGYENS